MTKTELHPRLAADCLLLGHFPLCQVLLMNDAHYPWIILVPDREAISEVWQLCSDDQIRLAGESSALAAHMQSRLDAHKMNVAALGNVVPQLHIHHIARYRHDAAWPKPVWGVHPSEPYSDEARAELLDRLALEQLPAYTAI